MKLLYRKGVNLLLSIIVLTVTALPFGSENKAFASVACDGVTPGTTADCPVMIYDAAGLNEMRALTGHYALGADIDMTAYLGPGGAGYNGGDGWVPVGSGGGVSNAFRGTFNGNGHTISHLKIDSTAGAVGLFGATSNAIIRNVGLIDVAILGAGASSNVGGLVGYHNGTIENAYVTGTVKGADRVGGLVGYATGVTSAPGRIRDSYASVTATGTGTGEVGGLVGYAEGHDLVITDSYYNSDLTGSSAAGIALTSSQMKQAASFGWWDFSAQGPWGIVEGETFPMHRATLDQILLDDLTVNDGAIAYEPAFAADTSAYSTRVTGEVDSITVSVYSDSSRISVSIDGDDTDSKIVPLDPGDNSIAITAAADVAVPGADTRPFETAYTLQVIREDGIDYPHRISTASQLAEIGTTAHYGSSDGYELMNDLDLSGLSWDPIGDGGQPFTGTFEGNKHVIRNLTVSGSADDAGLFAASSGIIRDLGLENASIAGGSRVGGLVGSNSGTVSNAYAKGNVTGDLQVGGLIGLNGGAANVAYTYAAGLVSGGDHTGGLIGENAGGSVTHSYWDAEAGGGSVSAGGEGKTTADMQLAATYSGWDFAGTWAMIEDTTYPMFTRHYDAVKLQALGVSSTAGVLAWVPAVFASAQGAYKLTADRYMESVRVIANPADVLTTVKIGAAESASAQVAVKAGSNSILIGTTGIDGAPVGAYRLTVDVPAPGMTGLQAPPVGYYGIGDALTFTVSYEDDVDVAGVPTIPLTIGEGASATTVYATYAGQPAGEKNKLLFTYAVQEGLIHSNDLAIGTDIQLPGGAAIHAAATTVAVPLALPATPTAGIRIDSVKPAITLSQQPASAVTTRDPVTVTATLDGTGSGIAATKWSEGTRTAADFATVGQSLTGNSFQVTANGTYSVYAIDEAGNEAVERIAIANIRTASSGGSGSSGPVAEPPTPSKGPTITLDAGGGITIRMDSSTIVKETLGDGTKAEHVALTDDILGQVSELLKKARKPYVTVVIDPSGQSVEARFSWASLAKMKNAYPSAVFKVELSASSYELPLNALNPAPQTKQVNLILAKLAGNEKERLEKAVNNAGLMLISDAAEFKRTESADGQTREVRDFGGGTYLIRGIVPYKGAPGERMTAVLYDPATGTLSFVPAVTAARADGQTEIAIKAPRDGIYALVESGKSSFSDLNGHWARSDAELLASKRIVSGVSGTTFAPGSPITRAEFTALLVRALGLKIEPTVGDAGFADVSKEDWFAPVIQAGVQAGLVEGLSRNEFAPGARITREQIAVMFGRALAFLGHPEPDADRVPIALSKFGDSAEISAWARSAVAQSVSAGLISGTTKDAIAPFDEATRAQTVVMLRRFLQYVEFID